MAVLFHFLGFLLILVGGLTAIIAWASSMGIIWIATGIGTAFSSLSFFAIYGVLSRLDKLIETKQTDQDRRRIEPR